MPPVFAHGRLRLYLLKLLDEAPRHGYEVIRLLEERFQGLYAPSAGTVYPRLAKLEAEGLVTHATEGGRKVYSITASGRAELAERSGELADLEVEIRDSVSELAAEIRDDVRGAAGKLRSEMRAAADETRGDGSRGAGRGLGDLGGLGPDGEAWRAAKEELRRAKQEWQEQTRRAKDESRRAREDARAARRQAREAQETARAEMERIARQVQEQVQERLTRGEWPTGMRQGLADLVGQLGGLARGPAGPEGARPGAAGTGAAGTGPGGTEDAAGDGSADPARELERLLDRFRDDVRDAARDHGVTREQLSEARRHLSTAAAHLSAVLRPDRG
ncbi:PadR family transcriptional regulator [Streptomyces sp. C10-9-1]|uniref:PadR family transcriptional regulator n=1 Tax=Streptomyces sp. C10-9-1 TaxID=1859285 RepID=UPI003F4A749E